MYRRLKDFFALKIFSAGTKAVADNIFLQSKINSNLSRAAVSSSLRNVDPANPISWEFSGFSQNGEDGIIDYLTSRIKTPNKYFVEIGSNNGIENNSAYLAHVKKFSGLQIEGNPAVHEEALKSKAFLVECFNCFVKESTIDQIVEKCLYKDPDVFSLDIDGMDYYIANLLFKKSIRPKIVVVEYNSAFGPDNCITIKYKEDFNMFATPHPYLYYGVSLNGWKHFFSKLGYHFVTVESNGVNAFFIDKSQFDESFILKINGLAFEENKHQLRLFKSDWKGQFEKISKLDFFDIT